MSGRIEDFQDLRWAVRGMAISQVLGAVCALGVADCFAADEATSVAAIAAACGTDAQIVRRLVRLLAALGIFGIDGDDAVRHTATSVMLRRDGTPSAFDAIRFWTMPAIWGAWGALQTGVGGDAVPFAAANGRGFFDHLAGSGQDRDIFQALMKRSGFIDRHEMIAAALTVAPGDVVVDVGGGAGHLLSALLARNPQVRGALFDLPEVLDAAAAAALAETLGTRCRLVAGDFFKAVPSDGTVYVLSWVLHDWPDAAAEAILGIIRRDMAAGSRLVIVDRLLNADPAACDAYDLLEDVNMFVLFRGRERTHAEFDSLLGRSGFASLTVSATRPGFSVLETRAR